MVDILAWVGTLTFAVSGALIAVEKRFDLVGIIVLAGVTAVGGGSIRDIVV
ncbi:MAG: TRIC cation channel family protein, partial [Meiothermus silvanus]|nr:TRIC cation channel family protein [Allomeiothermus silvanus]